MLCNVQSDCVSAIVAVQCAMEHKGLHVYNAVRPCVTATEVKQAQTGQKLKSGAQRAP